MKKKSEGIKVCQTFESLKQIDGKCGFWSARKLAEVFEYSEFRHFLPVIEKAKKACENSGYEIEDHFVDVHEILVVRSGAKRKMSDVKLSRYACYLIIQNADPTKPVIAIGQTYFAIQARRQELSDNVIFQQLKEDEKYLFLINELEEDNKQLVETAKLAKSNTAIDFAIFQDHGYRGLYGGLDVKGIYKHKGLKKSQKILDYMGSTELAANLFQATQTDEKLKREKIKEKAKANKIHYEVGKKVRQTIKELGGDMPEDLPKAEKGINVLEKKPVRKNIKKREEE